MNEEKIRELSLKYKVSYEDIEKAFIVSDMEFEYGTKTATPESFCEHWYGNPRIPPIWRTK